MKADVVFVFRIDTAHVPALTERMQQVVAEFDTLAVKQDQPWVAESVPCEHCRPNQVEVPAIGSLWTHRESEELFRVIETGSSEPHLEVVAVRVNNRPGSGSSFNGSVAQFNRTFFASTG